MRYCLSCVLPESRPNLIFGADGVCDACHSRSSRALIDWKEREQLLGEVVKYAKQRSNGYDCVVPVSGGKDSTWQVVKCLESDLNPLAVTWKCPSRTPIGQRNLDNLVSLGVDHIDYQVNPNTEKKFLLAALARFGTTAIPMHMAIFNIPLKIAMKFDIPLVVWGENSALEYGGANEETQGFRLDSNWVKRFGVTHGTTAKDWVSSELTARELTPYFGPTDDELQRKGIIAVFLGHYLQWDPEISLAVAKANGFLASTEGAKTGLYDYADIDDDFISIHHFLKWYKFGFTRLFDNLSLEIRAGRMTRAKAVEIIRVSGDQTPHADIDKFCSFTQITKRQFFEIIEKFRDPRVWTKQRDRWVIKDFIIPDWKWA